MVELIIIIAAVVVVVVGGGGTTLLLRSRRSAPPSPPPPSTAPDRGVGHGGAATTAPGPASATGTAERGEAGTAVPLEPDVAAPPARPAAPAEKPPPSAGRLIRLRSRLARSQSALGGALLGLLSSDRLDEQTWEEVEDTLITADMGVGPARQLVEQLAEGVETTGRTADANDRKIFCNTLGFHWQSLCLGLFSPTSKRCRFFFCRYLIPVFPASPAVLGWLAYRASSESLPGRDRSQLWHEASGSPSGQ